MATGTYQERVESKLRQNRARTRYLVVFAILAALVATVSYIRVRQEGKAKVHDELVLDCPFVGIAAHTHTADCYNAQGDLVCPLPERELHVHDESCYEEERILACGMEEGEGAHTHTEECYDEDGELICGLEESEGHVHDDSCYVVSSKLVCGKEEITEEHVHGTGCFKVVVVEDVEPEEGEGENGELEAEPEAAPAEETEPEPEYVEVEADNAEPSYPAQEFEGAIMDGMGAVVLKVRAEAPEGALPEGATMHVEANGDPIVEDAARSAVEDPVLSIRAVDVTFYDAEGNEIEPLLPVKVTMHPTERYDESELVVVHVGDDGQGQVVDQDPDRTTNDEAVFDSID